jgi:hypothetical protein
VTGRLPTSDEQAFLAKLVHLLCERRGFGLSFELEGPRTRIVVHPPYAAPAHVIVTVYRPHSALSENRRPVTVHDVATRLVSRVRKGLG